MTDKPSAWAMEMAKAALLAETGIEGGRPSIGWYGMQRIIALALDAAVAEEREACAKVADNFTNAGPEDFAVEPMVGAFQRRIGAAIRKRS